MLMTPQAPLAQACDVTITTTPPALLIPALATTATINMRTHRPITIAPLRVSAQPSGPATIRPALELGQVLTHAATTTTAQLAQPRVDSLAELPVIITTSTMAMAKILSMVVRIILQRQTAWTQLLQITLPFRSVAQLLVPLAGLVVSAMTVRQLVWAEETTMTTAPQPPAAIRLHLVLTSRT